MNIVKILGSLVSVLQPWNWVKSFAKTQAKAIVTSEIDKLQLEGEALIKKHGPGGVDLAFDASQKRLQDAIDRLKWIPGFIKNMFKELISEQGDRFQAKAKLLVIEQGVDAYNQGVDGLQAALLEKIERL